MHLSTHSACRNYIINNAHSYCENVLKVKHASIVIDTHIVICGLCKLIRTLSNNINKLYCNSCKLVWLLSFRPATQDQMKANLYKILKNIE